MTRANSNGRGAFPATTIQASMQAYDGFPASLRRTLQTAVGRYSGEQIAALLSRGVPAADIERHIRREDASKTLRDYGPQHPEART